MHHNFIYYTADWTNKYSMGLYHDGGTINIDTYHNLIFCTEEGVRFTYDNYVFTHLNAGTTHQTDVWNNAEIKRAVKGGRDGLVPSDYPDGMMFDAGSTIGRPAYTRNYEMIINNSPELNTVESYISAENAVPGEGAERIGGDIRLDKAGEWVKFEDVDFGEGGNLVYLYYKGDRYKTPPQLQFVMDNLESGKVYEQKDVYFRGRTTEDKNVLYKNVSAFRGVRDVYVRMTTDTAAIDICGIKTGINPRLNDITVEKSTIYGGKFTEQTENKPEIKYGAEDDFVSPYAAGVSSGACLEYKDVEVERISDIAVINYCTDEGSGGQTLQVRTGSKDSEPVAEFVTAETGSGKWTQELVSLKEPLEAGKYDFYVTFADEPDAEKKAMNLYYIRFADGVEERAKRNTIYGGNFNEYVASPQGEFDPAVKYGANSDDVNPFVNNTWVGSTLVYKNFAPLNDTNRVIVNHCTSGEHSGQSVQIRVGSATAPPIAEFVTQNTGWGNWTDMEVPLKEVLKAGTYDIYVTFEEPDGKYAPKTTNFYYFRFSE